jgi:hypothetical protein
VSGVSFKDGAMCAGAISAVTGDRIERRDRRLAELVRLHRANEPLPARMSDRPYIAELVRLYRANGPLPARMSDRPDTPAMTAPWCRRIQSPQMQCPGGGR